MRPAPGLLLLLLTSGPPAFASTQCLPSGADCKQPAVADAINYVTQVAAFGAAFKDQKLMQQLEAAARAKLGAAGNKTPTEAQVWTEMREATERAVKGVVLPAESSTRRDSVSGFTDEDCHTHFVVAETKEDFYASDEERRHGPNTCTEFLDATYEHEKFHSQRCSAAWPVSSYRTRPAQARAAEDAEAYRIQLHFILDAMHTSNPECSPTDKDIKRARDSFHKSLEQEMNAMKSPAPKGGHK